MSTVLVAVDGPLAEDLATRLARTGLRVAGVVPADAATAALEDADAGIDAIVLEVSARTLTARLIAVCDRRGVRVLPLCADPAQARLAAAFGVGPAVSPDADAWTIADALAEPAAAPAAPAAPAPALAGPGVLVVWGPAGAPGRSTLAVELATELGRRDRHVCLVDADSHAPSVALRLGLADEGPGFAAACRQAGRGGLDAVELARISVPVPAGDGRIDVLAGLNRPSRWPELSEARVVGALDACRGWAQHTVVDVASSLERDEEIMSDLTDGPRRNGATLAAVRSADRIVAVLSADPVGVARFLRAYPELRQAAGSVPVTVVVNRLRPGALGIDARGQIRRTLERFAGIREMWFVPEDARSADAALLTSRPAAEGAPRSALAQAVRRLAADLTADPAPPARALRRGRRAAAAAGAVVTP